MLTFTANDAKNKFGEMIDAALQAPVSITKHSRRSVVVMSDAEYQNLAAGKYTALKEAVTAGFDQLDRGEYSSLTVDDILERVIERKNAPARA
tara:strand:- start:413 stop:691 length:279 start_codon:yes stop_codon:yes gene_type:complete